MEDIIQIALYRQRYRTRQGLLLSLIVKLVILSGLLALIYWIMPIPSVGRYLLPALLLGGGAWLFQYHDYFFPVPLATLLLAYGELRIVSAGKIHFFLDTRSDRLMVERRGDWQCLRLAANAPTSVLIAYSPANALLAPSSLPKADYVIYRQADWRQLTDMFSSSLSLRYPERKLPMST